MPRKHSQAQHQDSPVADREPGDDAQETLVQKIRPWQHDNRAGVELIEYTDKENNKYEMWLRFRDGDPGVKIRQFAKDNDFIWEPDAPAGGRFDVTGAWAHQIAYKTRNQDKLHCRRAFREVVDMMLEAKGLAPERQAEPGTPF